MEGTRTLYVGKVLWTLNNSCQVEGVTLAASALLRRRLQRMPLGIYFYFSARIMEVKDEGGEGGGKKKRKKSQRRTTTTFLPS